MIKMVMGDSKNFGFTFNPSKPFKPKHSLWTMKKILMGLSKVTALHYILPATLFDAHDEITKLLWDCVVEQDPTWQESQGPTDKCTLLPFSLRHIGNTQSGSGMLVCSIQENFTPFLLLSGKKNPIHLQQNSFIILHSWTPTQKLF